MLKDRNEAVVERVHMRKIAVVSSSGYDARSPIGMHVQRATDLVLGVALALHLYPNAARASVSAAAALTATASFAPICPAPFEQPQGGQRDRTKDTDLATARRQLLLGETMVDVVISERPESKHLFCNLHDDENTAVEAGVVALRRLKGRLVELQHGGKRNITFQLDGEAFVVDPNRIFTTEGVRQTLAKLSRRTREAEHAVERFAKDLLSIYSIERTDVVIALHNNSEGAYSALSYKKGGEFASNAAEVFIKDGNDPDDFFFVTETAEFDALRRRRYNVVLQDNRRVTDDGSLSVYCGRAGVRYINVEAQQGHLEQQVAMISALQDVLNGLGQSRSR
jgi:hypothetical protein